MLTRPRQAVILAGGRGTRMRPFTDTLPKHLYPFAGRPFAEHLVELLAAQGFERILFLTGYLAQATRAHFGDGRRWGVDIGYRATPAAWETGPRLAEAAGALDPVFLLCYSDNYWPLRMIGAWQHWHASAAEAQITVYSNHDGYTRSNVRVEGGHVRAYDPARREHGLGGVDIGFALVRRSTVEQRLPDENASFQAGVYPALAAEGRLAAWVTDHRYYSAGSPERLAATEAFFARRPAVLVDRDGVLNRRPPLGDYVKSWDEWEWLPGAREALARFHRAGYRVIVVSNQAGVARGLVGAEALEQIHARLREQAEQAGGRIDAIYTCPHHWESGCACRKPKPGMLFAAQRDFHLDLTRTFYLGDDERDAQAAEAAGCLFGLVSESTPLAGYAEAWLAQQETTSPCVSS